MSKRERVDACIAAIHNAIGGELTAGNIGKLTADQVTLLVWETLRDEMMSGGFVQLIYNGYGTFVFKNPFAKAVKAWGMTELSKLVYDAHRLYKKHHERIETDCDDDEFMALYEQFPDFDELDDEFVDNEEKWTEQIADYIEGHIENFDLEDINIQGK